MTAHLPRPDRSRARRLRARRSLLLSGALGASLLLAARPDAASAQAINATPATTAGNVSYSRFSTPTPGSETISINTNTAIISWTPPNPPLPDPYIFLPAGNVVTFQNGFSNLNFVVLNRILVNVPSRFDGTVISRIGGANPQPGGTVLFSSPGGIVLGPTAFFDVGNLVLTSLNVVDDGQGNFITPSGGFAFGSGAGPPNNGSVVTLPGSRIVAGGEGSYVALVAPQVTHGGSAFVNGSTAFIAAEQVEFSVNQGLFDIIVTAGTDLATPIVHTGSTGGPASSGGGDNHNIYAVAVARAQPITLLLQGAMGYEAATVADLDNGVIVLSAGYNVTGGQIDPTPVPAPPASIELSDGQFSSNVVGRATGTITGTATLAAPLDFAEDLNLQAVGALSLLGTDINVGGLVDLAGATIDVDSLIAGDTIFANSAGAITVENARSDGTIVLFAGGPADLGTLDAANSLSVTASSIALASATAGIDVLLNSSGNIAVTFAQAGDDFVADTSGTFTGGTVLTTGLGDDPEDIGGGSNILVDASGDLRLDNGDAFDDLNLTSVLGNVLSSGLLDAGADMRLNAGADTGDIVDILINQATSGGIMDLSATGALSADSLIAGADITGNFGTDATVNAIDTGGSLLFFVAGAVDLGTVVAAGDVIIDPTTIDIDSVIAGGDIALDATGDINVGFAEAGDDFTATAGGAFSGGTIVTTGLGLDSDDGLVGSNIIVDANGDLRLDNGTAPDTIDLASATGSVLSDGTLTANQLLVSAAVNIDLNDVDVVSSLSLSAPTGFIDGNSFTSGGDITLNASGDIGVGFAQAGDDFVANAGGAFTGGTVISTGLGSDSEIDTLSPLGGYNIFVNAGDDLRLDNGDAPDDIQLNSRAGSVLSSGLLNAGSDIRAVAGVDIDITGADALGDVSLSAQAGNIGVVSSQAGDDFVAFAGGTFSGGAVTVTGLGPDSEGGSGALAGSNILVTAGGDLRLDDGSAPDRIDLTSVTGSILSGGTLTADLLLANAAVDILLNDVFVVSDLILATPGGRIAGNSFNSDGDIDLDASGNIDIATAQAGDDFVAVSGGAFTGGTVVVGLGPDSEGGSGALAGANIVIDAVGDLRLDTGTAPDLIDLASSGGSILSSGTLTADTLLASAALDLLLNDVFVVSDLDLTTLNGDIAGNSFTSGGNITLDSSGNVTLADASSDGSILVTAGGAADLGTFVATGDIDVDAASIALTSATAGGDIGLAASGNIGVTLAQAGDDFVANAGGAFAGGTVTVTGAGADSEGGAGALAGSNIVIDANGNLRLDNGTAPGAIDLASATGSVLSGGTLTADRLLADAALDIALNNVSVVADLTLTAFGGSISGNSFDSDGDISLDAAGSVTLAAADAGGNIGVAAGTTANLGTFVAVGDITVDANGNLRLDNGTAGGTIDLASATGSVLSAGTLTADSLLASAAVDLALGNVDVVADLTLTTTNGSISGNAFSSDGNIVLSSAQNVTLASATSGGLVQIGANGNAILGAVTAATDINVTGAQINLSNGNAGRDITLGSTGTVTVGTANAAGRFIAVSAGTGTFNNLSAGTSVAILSAGGSARFTGAVAAPTIVVNSTDIDIAAGATIGNSATQSVNLTARPTGQQTVLGGSTQGPGYTLTDAEADRITAATLNIQAFPTSSSPTRAPDVLVRDLSLSGQQIGTLQLVTSGILQVEGGLILSGVQATGGIQIQATERLQVVTPTGSIRVRDAAGLTSGSLTIASNNIWAASQSLLDQLRADANFTGRDAALLLNTGPVEPRGYIEAGDVVLSARDTLFVQNSGTFFAFAGITVRENTLRLVPTGTQPLRVFAFGRRINPDGSFVLNNIFFGEVDYQGRGGPVGYTDDAQFNLCFINSGVCRLASPENPLPGGPEIIEEPVDSSTTIAFPGARDDLVDTSFAQEPLIEEPVTSGSDSILWDCDTDDDGDCDEDDVNG